MKIVFGWHLDGQTFPEIPDGGACAVDAAVAGPLEFLDLLETRLGLNSPSVAPALRIAQYLSRLRALDDGERFYSRSLAADGWATARLLLGWRDELVAAGWSPGSTSWQSPRLASFAKVETEQDTLLAPGPADRVRSIAACLADASPVDELTLVDDVRPLPLVWRRLIAALGHAGAKIDCATLEPGAQDDDLALVQALLATGKRARLTGDQSFAFVECDNELVAADIAAEWLTASPDTNNDLAIVRQGDGTILDAACRRLGLPRPGGSWRSPYRGALQSLPLAFETAWQPLDAARLLEMLVMPGSPVPHQVGRCFAEVLRAYPGSGGTDWQAAWPRAIERWREKLHTDGLDEAEIDKAIGKSMAEWRGWLEPDRFSRTAGIPARDADAICRKVQLWAQRRAAASADTVYRQTSSTAGALANTIAASGIDPIPKPQLDRMIDAVIADGVARPGTVAESASWTTVDGPEQIWRHVPAVLWWGFSDPEASAPRPPWNDAEKAELVAAGTDLLSPGDSIARDLGAQRRAILGATRRILLVKPKLTAAEPAAAHPLWHEIATMHGLEKVIVDGRSLRRRPRISLCARNWQPLPVEASALPRPIRDWSVARNRVGARDTESATSLESLLGCPLNWVLQYRAGLRTGGLLDMAEGNQLKGIVSHAVLARFFAGPVPDDRAEIRRRVAAMLDDLLPEIGSSLLLPGQVHHRDELRRNTIESAVALVGMLRSAGLSVSATEQELTCNLDDRTDLVGAVDLELATRQGTPAIVDLKWSNRAKYRQEEIEEGRPVQLATYGRLLRGQSPAFPPAGYFMIKQQRLLAVDAEPFPGHARIEGSDLEAVWGAVLEARSRALDRLAAGQVVATGVEAEDGQAETPADPTLTIDPPCRLCAYGGLCGVSALS